MISELRKILENVNWSSYPVPLEMWKPGHWEPERFGYRGWKQSNWEWYGGGWHYQARGVPFGQQARSTLLAASRGTTDISLPNQPPNQATVPLEEPPPSFSTALPVQTPQPISAPPITQPQLTPETPNFQNILGVVSVNVVNLKKLIALLEGSKITIPAQALSPFSTTVKETPLSHGYKNTSDLHFHGNTYLVEFLRRFSIKMDVYQVPELASYRMVATTFKDNTQNWFQKLGADTITTLANVE